MYAWFKEELARHDKKVLYPSISPWMVSNGENDFFNSKYLSLYNCKGDSYILADADGGGYIMKNKHIK